MTATNTTPAKHKATTREDVARRARVSVATVSMGLRGDPRIKKETARLVKMVARELNYRPKASASALAGGKTHTIGFVFAHPRFEDRALIRAYSRLIECVGELLSSRNYHLNLVVQPLIKDEKGGHKLPRMFNESGIDGILVVHRPYPMLAEALEGQGVPYVLLDSEPIGSHAGVYIDECRAAEIVVEYLIDLGHRQIANLSTLPAIDAEEIGHRMLEFPRGYLRAMSEAGLPAMRGWDKPFSSIDQRLQELWSHPEPPTAIVTYDDQIAGQVIKWLSGCGLKVPEDISVAALHDTGYADLNWGITPSITCIDNMQETIAAVAVDKLLDEIEKPQIVSEAVCLQPKLVVRQSTSPAASRNDS